MLELRRGNEQSGAWRTRPAESALRSEKTLFLVNGDRSSAGGRRARRIGTALGAGRAEIVYRAGSKALDVARFGRSALNRQYGVLYAMDLALVPVAATLVGSLGHSIVVDTGDAPAAFLALVSTGRLAGAKVLAARTLERLGYGTADAIIVRSQFHRNELLRRGYEDVTYVPDGVDVQVFRPWSDSALRQQLGLDGLFTVGVQGYFTWYPRLGGGLGCEVVEAIALTRDLPVHAVLIGDGPGMRQLQMLASERGVADRIHVLGRIPYDQLPRYLGLCDICISTQTNEESSWVRTTGKLPGYLASGRYVLASRVGTAAEILPDEMLIEYHGAWDRTYPTRLAERIVEAFHDEERAAKGLALRAIAGQFDYENVARAAADVVVRTGRTSQ